jgi:uncharacterized protein (TIGR02588 family)
MDNEQKVENRLQKNALEWSVFALGLLLVTSTLGYLTWAALTQGDEPAQLEVRLSASQQRGKKFVVPVSVVNLGDRTAEGVMIAVTLENSKGQEVESAEFEIAFVPRHSKRDGEVLFKHDPRSVAKVQGRVLGYETP